MFDLPGIALESSFVLGIQIEPYAATFSMDFALTPEHPLFRTPPTSEQECFRRGELVFKPFREVRWKSSGLSSSIDANAEVDFGNLDELLKTDTGWRLGGEWGVIEIAGGEISVLINQVQ